MSIIVAWLIISIVLGSIYPPYFIIFGVTILSVLITGDNQNEKNRTEK